MIGINKITSLPVSGLNSLKSKAIVEMIEAEVGIFGNMEEGFREHYFAIFIDKESVKENKFRYIIN